MNDRDALVSFETEMDKKIVQSNICKLPLMSVLTYLFVKIDVMIRDKPFEARRSNMREVADAIGSRLSYLTEVFEKCTLEILANPVDAYLISEEFTEDFHELISYAHFSELMPEVHRNYYEVRKCEEGFELIHPNEDFARAEVSDIILTELSLTFLVGEIPDLKQEFIELAAQFPRYNIVLMYRALSILFQYRLNSIKEVPLLEPNAFQRSIGIKWEDFCKVRAALFAYTDYSIGLADGLMFLGLNESNNARKEAIFHEFYKWVVVSSDKSSFMNLLMALTNVKSSVIESILKFFTLDIENQNFKNVGDGFFPPLVDYSSFYFFSPHILRSVLTGRNIFYVVNKCNSTRFNNSVSKNLEPTLLKQALEIFKTLPDLETFSNKKWKKGKIEGEFDLLIYQSSSNTMLHIQAKAAIPPQGARMTKAVETRSIEGIGQLDRFQDLPENERDSVISNILGKPVEKVQCVSVLLCRAGLGTHSVWELKKDITVVNLQLLNKIIQILFDSNFNLSHFKRVTDDFLIDIYNKSVLGWMPGYIYLNGVFIRMPLLQLNHNEILKIMRQMPESLFVIKG